MVISIRTSLNTFLYATNNPNLTFFYFSHWIGPGSAEALHQIGNLASGSWALWQCPKTKGIYIIN